MKKLHKLTVLVMTFSLLLISQTATGATSSPAITTISTAQSSDQAYSGNSVTIDASEIGDGLIKVSYSGTSTSRLKARVTCPNGTVYTYNLNTAGNAEAFPLTEGNGKYTIGVYQNVTGTKYAELFSKSFDVALSDAFSPFLRSNQYINYSSSSQVVTTGKSLIEGKTTTLAKVEAVYNHVVKNFTYDTQKANSVQSGYLPVLDTVLQEKKGICFDYAAVMAAMLRSNQIPTRMVVGYSGDIYHAWLDVYTPEKGWINEVIFFDGQKWKLMDPTFASNASSSEEIMKYIGNSSNYQAKYVY